MELHEIWGFPFNISEVSSDEDFRRYIQTSITKYVILVV